MWITTPPDGVEQDVFVQYPDGRIDFGFAVRNYNQDGSVRGMSGPWLKPIVAYQPIPLPQDKGEGWNDTKQPPKEGRYVVAVLQGEKVRLRKAFWDGVKWDVRASRSQNVQAWREMPAASGRSH